MVPAAITGLVVDELAALLELDDVIIDGGNSYYRDDIDRADTLGAKGIHYVDVGTSGGIFGLERGFCLMIGGEPEPSAVSTRSLPRSPPASRRRLALPAAPASPRPPSAAICTADRAAPATSSR
jgi:6-phosphogluconate dehydrogenase